MPPLAYLTYFHRRNIPQVQCLIASIRRFDRRSWIVCIVDNECWSDAVPKLDLFPFIACQGMKLLEETCYPDLPWGLVRKSRSERDTAWTAQACMPWWIMTRDWWDADVFIYVDSDVQMLQSLQPILEVMPPQAFVGLSEHYYPTGRENNSAGRFNNGLCIWRNTPEAVEFARGWGERTIAEMSPDKGYEQGELTRWPELLQERCWIMPKGCNVGPWRLAKITGDPPALDDGTLVQSFHHHETRPHPGNNPFTIKGQVWNYTNYAIAPETLKSIHEPYGRMIEEYL